MSNVKTNILKFIHCIQSENYAHADRYLASVVKEKFNKRYSEEYDKLKKQKKDK